MMKCDEEFTILQDKFIVFEHFGGHFNSHTFWGNGLVDK